MAVKQAEETAAAAIRALFVFLAIFISDRLHRAGPWRYRSDSIVSPPGGCREPVCRQNANTFVCNVVRRVSHRRQSTDYAASLLLAGGTKREQVGTTRSLSRVTLHGSWKVSWQSYLHIAH